MACFPGLGSSSRSIERIGTEIGDLEQCGQPQLQPVSRCGTRLLDVEARHLTQQLVLTAREQDTKEARDWLGIVRRSLRCRRQYAIFSGPLKLTKVSSRDIQARSPKLPVRARAARQVLRYPSQRSPERSKLEIPRYSAVRDLIQLSIY